MAKSGKPEKERMHLQTGSRKTLWPHWHQGQMEQQQRGGSEEAGWGRLYKPQNAVLRSSDLPAGNWKTSDDFVKMVAWCINFVTLLSVDQSTGTS